MGWFKKLREKLNPAQEDIFYSFGEDQNSTAPQYTITQAYEKIEVVNRGVNLVVDSAAGIDFDIKDKIHSLSESDTQLRPEKLYNLLNRKPNPFQDINTFRRNLYLDLILEGNFFIYFDGAWMYQLPAADVEIEVSKTTYIEYYKYDDKEFYPNEIIHVKDNSARSIFRGDSRLLPTLNSINVLAQMENYQTNFFKNGAVLGLVLKTPNALSQKVKDRIIEEWMHRYSPSNGRRPALLDGDMTIESLGTQDFRELDFQESTTGQENQILKAIGVPPILLDSGNNANITPNLRMFYINTIIPIVESVVYKLEYYFGYDLKPALGDVIALRPDLKEQGAYYGALVNNGIMKINEAREELRLEKVTDDPIADQLIKPANIAGSATDANQGGKPKEPKEE